MGAGLLLLMVLTGAAGHAVAADQGNRAAMRDTADATYRHGSAGDTVAGGPVPDTSSLRRWGIDGVGKMAGAIVVGINLVALFLWVAFRQRRED
jgi:hypothetical protein